MDNMISKISLKLEERQYHRVKVNVEGITLYYSVINDQAYLVVIFNDSLLNQLNINQYEHIIYQMKVNFLNKRYKSVSLLSILCTGKADSVKEFCVDTDNHWILDIDQEKLIIYENQESNYLNLKNVIQELIDEQVRSNRGTSYQQEYRSEGDTTHKYKMFSLYNSVIIVVNILVFVILEWLGSTKDTRFMLSHGALYWPYVIREGQWYRVFTYMFLHFGIGHIFNNMMILAFLGDNLERAIGKSRYVMVYLGTGVIAGLASMGYNMLQKYNVIAVGASGAIFGVVGSLLYVVIVNRGHLENMSAKRLFIFAILSIYSGFTSQGTDNIAHVAGFIAGFIISIILYKKPKKSEVL